MQVNFVNAIIVATLFDRLADERFSMRSPAAIVKGTDIHEAQVLDIAAQIGLQFRRRVSDNSGRLLIQRPDSVEQAVALRDRALAILHNGHEPFELDLTPQQVQGAATDTAADYGRIIQQGIDGADAEAEAQGYDEDVAANGGTLQ